jgi:lipopolysaccharide/colanic/teichoic acid biosynthesis glycosyltransferase
MLELSTKLKEQDRQSASPGIDAPAFRLSMKGHQPMFIERTHIATWQPRPKAVKDHAFTREQFAATLYPMAKTCLDVLIAGFALILLAPFMLIIAVAIKVTSPGPAMITQRRVGLNGQIFDFYKFRSMTYSKDHVQEHKKFAEAYINGQRTEHHKDDNGHSVFKPAANGRIITPVGRWLRRMSLDELPQLINILKGDMSLVGPRPSMEYELPFYTERQYQRLAVLPGLTGWAQINGRSSLSFEEIVTLDVEYITHRSLEMDLRILGATIPVVLGAEYAG